MVGHPCISCPLRPAFSSPMSPSFGIYRLVQMAKIVNYMTYLYYKGVKELKNHCHLKNFLPTLDWQVDPQGKDVRNVWNKLVSRCGQLLLDVFVARKNFTHPRVPAPALTHLSAVFSPPDASAKPHRQPLPPRMSIPSPSAYLELMTHQSHAKSQTISIHFQSSGLVWSHFAKLEKTWFQFSNMIVTNLFSLVTNKITGSYSQFQCYIILTFSMKTWDAMSKI